MSIIEQDPKIQELVNVNPGDTEGQCAIETY